MCFYQGAIEKDILLSKTFRVEIKVIKRMCVECVCV